MEPETKATTEQQIGWAIEKQLRQQVIALRDCADAVRENSTLLFELLASLGVPFEAPAPPAPPAPKKRGRKAKKAKDEG